MIARLKLRHALIATACAVTGAASAQPAGVLNGAAAYGDYTADRPGVTRRIGSGDLPAPNPSESVPRFPQVVPRPAGAQLQTLPGFTITQYADQIANPRTLRLAPNGDVFVAQNTVGKVAVMRPGANGGPPTVETFAEGLAGPFGIAFYPADNPKWVYVAETNAVKRFPYQAGDMKARGPAETVVEKLADTGGGHVTRDVAFTKDGSRMLVSIGSQSNYPDKLSAKTPAEITAFEKEHGLGAAWDNEVGRAAVQSFTPDGKDRKPFATGIRNCVGLLRHPTTGDIYCAVNERDALGNNLVPDYLTRVKEGGFYGWPWYYIGDHVEPRMTERPELKGKVTTPDVLFQAHSAAINTTFYPTVRGGPAFPAEYQGDGFQTLHGSWNRATRTGYKIVRVKMRNGVPTGEYEDFVTGFVVDNAGVWGRPSGITVLKDGSLLFSDDAGNKVWRVAYTGR